jgi:mannosyl-oligosaccharide alpha-1,2-mannosidase
MLRQLHVPRLASLLSRRQLRYVVIAILLFLVFTVALPRYSVHHDDYNSSPFATDGSPIPASQDGGSKYGDSTSTRPSSANSANSPSPFHIQYAFKEETDDAKQIRTGRQQKVREAFLHAWKGYKEHGWLHDEVMPLSGGYQDPFAGWAATLVDSLDSLYILGLQDEFDYALKALGSINFSKPKAERVPVFETTIRYLGGLLGAYDVSGGKYPILLKKADELGEFLYRAFNTKNGLPTPYFFWGKSSGQLQGDTGVLVAQIGNNSKP